MSVRAALVIAVVLLTYLAAAEAHSPAGEDRLPIIGLAPSFALTSQDGRSVALQDLRGKVVAVSFVFASCSSTCPLLMAKLVQVQDELGSLFGSKIAFVSITVDPENDTSEVLRQYARAFGANLAGWSFLTGDPPAVRKVIHRYGVFAAKVADGNIDHTNLTSLIDQHGNLRVQYLGVRFDPEEFRRDLVSLLDEP